MIKYVFFDVSGTLLGKPSLFDRMSDSLKQFGYRVSLKELKYKHKMLSEVIHFPDRTDEDFYNYFNSELLRIIGIIPDQELLKMVFNSCTYLPWEKYLDTKVLMELNLPIGVISNFNSSLREKLDCYFGAIFGDILVSEELGIAKPKLGFYEKALESIGYPACEVLYIGDSLKLDIEPAAKLGIKSLLIDRDNFYESSPFKISNLTEILKYI